MQARPPAGLVLGNTLLTLLSRLLFSAPFFATATVSVPDEALPAPKNDFPKPGTNLPGSRNAKAPCLPRGGGLNQKEDLNMIALIIACVAVAGIFMIAGYDYSSVKE